MRIDVEPNVLPEVLAVLRDLIREHRQRVVDQQPRRVVPVICAGFARWMPLLAEILRSEEGALIEAAEYVDGCDSGLSDPASLVQLVSAIREVEDSLADLHLALDNGVARVLGAGLGIDSDGVEVIRGILAALFHPDIRELDLVALVFEERALDEVVAAPLWSILMRLPGLLGLSPGGTVLVIAGDAVLNLDRHCTGDPSVRCRIREGEVLRRRTHEASIHGLKDVARLSVADAPLLFLFTGAGATAHYGLPTGNELRDNALADWLGVEAAADDFDVQAREFFDQLSDGGRLRPEERALGVEEFIRSLTLERVLREEQHRENQHESHTIRRFRQVHDHVIGEIQARARSGGEPSPLAALVRSSRPIVIVTVNFDRTLEAECGDDVKAFIHEGDYADLHDYIESYRANGGPVPYVKLHGDMSDPDTIVANVDETEAGLSRARLQALRELRSYPAPVRPWVYIGYSMRDVDVNAVVAAPDAADDTVESWVGPFIDPPVRAFIETSRVPRWRLEHVSYTVENRCVTLTATEYLDRLRIEIEANTP